MAPKIPVISTSAAVRVGSPPSRSAMPMATGAVVDFGASEASTCGSSPNRWAIASADPTATSDPASSPATIGSAAARIRARLSCIGSARHTVAGPSRKCTNCAPSK